MHTAVTPPTSADLRGGAAEKQYLGKGDSEEFCETEYQVSNSEM